MTQIPNALLEPPAPPAPHGKEPPGSPPDTPFAAVLDDHQARTADAEGHRRAEESPARDAARDGALAALLGGVPLAAGVTLVAPAAAAAPAEPEPAGGRVLSPGEASREQARGIVLTRATRPIGVPDATSLPLRPPVPGATAEAATVSSPSLPIGLGAAAAEGRGDGLSAAAAAPPAPARATRLADVLQSAVRAEADATAEPAAIPSPATAAGRAQNGDGQASAPTATSATPTMPASAPATPPATAHTSTPAAMPAVPARPVGLDHAVETVRLALRAGAERGVSHARISLTPRELGTIEVHLRHTAEGLVARVVAEHAGAAQQLQQAGAELRRSLEQQGVTLLRLDVGAFTDDPAGRRGAAFDSAAAFGEDRGRRRGADADPLAPLDGPADDADLTTTTLQLPNGALVDVLA